MRLRVLGSSSAGNCYLMESSSGEVLILEAGVPIGVVKEALSFDVDRVVGCLITHEHGDHARYLKDYVKLMDCYASGGTIGGLVGTDELDFRDRVKCVRDGELMHIAGGWDVIPFLVYHDAAEPFGFLIRHDEMGVCLFVTDTYYLPQMFEGLNQILIEANYSEALINRNLYRGDLHPVQYMRTVESHLSLEGCIKVLNGNDLSGVANIVLLHLSDANSDAVLFKDCVDVFLEENGLSGVVVSVADKGVDVELNYEEL